MELDEREVDELRAYKRAWLRAFHEYRGEIAQHRCRRILAEEIARIGEEKDTPASRMAQVLREKAESEQRARERKKEDGDGT